MVIAILGTDLFLHVIYKRNLYIFCGNRIAGFLHFLFWAIDKITSGSYGKVRKKRIGPRTSYGKYGANCLPQMSMQNCQNQIEFGSNHVNDGATWKTSAVYRFLGPLQIKKELCQNDSNNNNNNRRTILSHLRGSTVSGCEHAEFTVKTALN